MRMVARLVLGIFAIAYAVGCATNPSTTGNVGGIPIGGLAATPRASSEQVTLGRYLFHDARLSRGRDVKCSGCHQLSRFGVDGKPAGSGAGGVDGSVPALRVFNTRAHIAELWDARVSNVKTEAVETALADTLGHVPRYAQLFRAAFPGDAQPISLNNVSVAIEAFERGLVGNSRWDRFSAGESSALTIEEKHGLRVFMQSGCVACHNGPQVGGTMYQEVGIAYPWPNHKDDRQQAASKSIADRLILRVPSLKNIAETAPYFHDNSTSNLAAAIRLMGHHQLGIELSNEDVDAIAAWMRALSADIDQDYITAPDLPRDG